MLQRLPLMQAAATTPAALASPSPASGSRTIDEPVKVYVGLLTWCLNQRAIVAADAGTSASDEVLLRIWLQPLLAELCNALSSASPQSVAGATWESRLQCGDRACPQTEQGLPRARVFSAGRSWIC